MQIMAIGQICESDEFSPKLTNEKEQKDANKQDAMCCLLEFIFRVFID